MRFTMANSVVTSGKILRPLALVVAIALAVLILGAAARLLSGPAKSIALFLSAISLASEAITVEVNPTTVLSGEKFFVTWEHKKKTEDGAYDFLYPCRAGLRIMLETKESIPCNSAFAVTGKSSLAAIAEWNKEAPLDLPVTIAFTPQGADRPTLAATGIVTIASSKTISEAYATTTPKRSTEGSPAASGQTFANGSTTTIALTPRINPSGVPDLRVEIMATGILATTSTSSAIFIPKTSAGEGERAAIVFDVKNGGDNVSGEWRFRAQLPVTNGDFLSDIQPSLAPGNGVRFTIGFESLNNSGANTAIITVDPESKIARDQNRTNNSANVVITRGY